MFLLKSEGFCKSFFRNCKNNSTALQKVETVSPLTDKFFGLFPIPFENGFFLDMFHFSCVKILFFREVYSPQKSKETEDVKILVFFSGYVHYYFLKKFY